MIKIVISDHDVYLDCTAGKTIYNNDRIKALI